MSFKFFEEVGLTRKEQLNRLKRAEEGSFLDFGEFTRWLGFFLIFLGVAVAALSVFLIVNVPGIALVFGYLMVFGGFVLGLLFCLVGFFLATEP